MDGDLIVMRVHDRHLEHQTVARLIQYGEKGFPNVEAQLLNPTIFAAYNRGLILFGQELTLVPGQEKEQYAYYGQAWQCVFR